MQEIGLKEKDFVVEQQIPSVRVEEVGESEKNEERDIVVVESKDISSSSCFSLCIIDSNVLSQ